MAKTKAINNKNNKSKKPVFSIREGNLQLSLFKNPENILFDSQLCLKKFYKIGGRGHWKSFAMYFNKIEIRKLLLLLEKFKEEYEVG